MSPTCRECGGPVKQRTVAMGGVEKVLTPDRCVPCREAVIARVEAQSRRAEAGIRSDQANVPAGLVVYPDFEGQVAAVYRTVTEVPLVWITGGPYSGKTTLAGAVILRAVEAGLSARYEHASSIVDKERWKDKGIWLSVQILAVDGLFSDRSKLPAWLLDEIDHLLQRRRDEGLHTLITSTKSIRGVDAMADVDLALRVTAMAGSRGVLTLPERAGAR